MNGQLRQCRNGSLGILIVAGFLVSSGFQQASAAPAARPIISGGTIKTADGQLLRGCHAHILSNLTGTVTRFFTVRANVQRLKDEAHMNCIRVCLITPGWGGAASLDAALLVADSIIANCEAVGGVYAIVNYHGPRMSGDWELNAFWDKVAPRYKDRTCVIYGAVNELFYNPPADTHENYWGKDWMIDGYKNHLRNLAPSTIIMGLFEPVELSFNWGPFMRDIGPSTGITWANGKDCFSFHAYGSGTGMTKKMDSTRTFAPVMLSEFSFSAEGWTQLNIDGYGMPAEWGERNGVSWCVWQDRKPADQLSAVMNYLIPDAIAKKYTWWNNTTVVSPTATKTAHGSFRSRSFTIQANGRVLPDQPQINRNVIRLREGHKPSSISSQ